MTQEALTRLQSAQRPLHIYKVYRELYTFTVRFKVKESVWFYSNTTLQQHFSASISLQSQ